MRPPPDDVRIFMSFDLDRDEDLHDRLVEQSSRRNSGFEIAARSEAGKISEPWNELVRDRMRDVDAVIVVCGEHTRASLSVSAELRIAQEEQKPYFLLWGRREGMCTRPSGARHADSMYSWMAQTLLDQIRATLENSRPRDVLKLRK